MKKPELIAPAGGWSALRSAVASGADSIYFGIRGLNMRQGAVNFDLLEVKKIVDFLHSHDKKAYLALNVIVYNGEIKKVERILRHAKQANIDAVILWDTAVLSIAKRLKIRFHISTQASVSNIEAVKFYSQLGAKKIILARECTLKDIRHISAEIKKEKLPCSIEVFVHGAMCVSISGRCFLSHEAFLKSANRGECYQPCRRQFRIQDTDNESEYVLGEHSILSPKDLCTIDILDKLINSGIGAFKIEGRNRSSEYVRVATACYRKGIDAYFKNSLTSALKAGLINELKNVYNRGFEKGFYLGGPESLGGGLEKRYDKVYIGEIKKFYKKIGVAEFIVRNRAIKRGNRILISGKNTPATFADVGELEIDHQPVDVALKGKKIGIKLPFRVHVNDKIFLIEKKSVS